MPANGLRVNHYDFVALHSMWIIFLKGYCVSVRVEIIHKSKFLPGTVEKNSSTYKRTLSYHVFLQFVSYGIYLHIFWQEKNSTLYMCS